MTRITVHPSKAKGSVAAPPSKSMAHRMLLCAALAQGESRISHVALSQDILATLDGIRALGAEVDIIPESLGENRFDPAFAQTVSEQREAENQTPGKRKESNTNTIIIRGTDVRKHAGEMIFQCRESGSTMRFLMGISMLFDGEKRFYGSKTLLNRPFSVYETLCAEQGLTFERVPADADSRSDHITKQGYIRICGALQPGEFKLPGNISSQFVTGLLYLLPLLLQTSTIRLIKPIESRSYLELTLQAMAQFGVFAEWKEEDLLEISGSQRYLPCACSVEGDWSNAAFLDVFNLFGGEVYVSGLNRNSRQGDRVYPELFRKLCGNPPAAAIAATVAAGTGEKNVSATEETADASGLPVIDLGDCPDLGPVLMMGAAALNGAIFTGTKRLQMKESDRGAVMCEELAKCGIRTRMQENEITVLAGTLRKPDCDLDGHNDHRIVMSLTTLLSLTGGSLIGAEAVSKSYPDYYEAVRALGIEVEEDAMDH